jgi:CheY-like chemotaxis protein
MRITTGIVLRQAGYEVAEAEGGAAAIERIRSEPFDVVLTDLRMGDVDGMEVLRSAVEISPAYTAAWNDLGLALKRLKRPREAVAAFEKAISLDPTDVKPYVNLGLHYLAAGDKRGAWLVYRSLQQVDARGAEGLRQFILAAPGRD